jgi:type IV secretory pathway VirB9-like protein
MNSKVVRQLAVVLAGFSLTARADSDPTLASRHVSYKQTDIVLVAMEHRLTTLIVLPKEETILEITCGDKDFWAVNWTGNLAYLKPALPGKTTNFNIVTTSGNVYSLFASEVTHVSGAHPDLKVFLDPADDSMIVPMKGKPKYVLSEVADGWKQKAEEAEAQLTAQQAQLKRQVQKAEAEARATNSNNIQHDYRFSPEAARSPFNVSSIYHDDQFTYIEANPQETFALYEMKDGKPSLIQFDFDERTHRYSVPKIVDSGYLRVGKKELKFHRENS